jgi:hypothetical protein
MIVIIYLKILLIVYKSILKNMKNIEKILILGSGALKI